MSDRFRPLDDALRGSARDPAPPRAEFSSATQAGSVPSMEGRRSSRKIRTGAISSCSTSTSTATMAPGLGASHQTGWTGTVAMGMDLFARVDAKTLLETSRERIQSRYMREQSPELSRDRKRPKPSTSRGDEVGPQPGPAASPPAYPKIRSRPKSAACIPGTSTCSRTL